MNKRLQQIILECQNLHKKHGVQYEENSKFTISKYKNEIKSKQLISKCDKNEQYFAKQLCIANNLYDFEFNYD